MHHCCGFFVSTIAMVFAVALPCLATDLLVGSDGNNSVLRYDSLTGAFVGAFVTSGSGGLVGPRGLAFGPDGHLYVASRYTHSVLRYHGTTGAFLETFIPPGSGGLSVPIGLVFGPDAHLYVSSARTNSVLHG